MPSYATREDLEARVGPEEVARLADPTGLGAEGIGTLDAAIADVDGLIGAHLRGRWPAYLGTPTRLLTGLAADLILDRLARGPLATDDLRARAAAALGTLRQIAAGDVHPDDTAAAADDAEPGPVLFGAGRRVMDGGGY